MSAVAPDPALQAVEAGDLDTLGMLLDLDSQASSVDARDGQGNTLMHWAAQYTVGGQGKHDLFSARQVPPSTPMFLQCLDGAFHHSKRIVW